MMKIDGVACHENRWVVTLAGGTRIAVPEANPGRYRSRVSNEWVGGRLVAKVSPRV